LRTPKISRCGRRESTLACRSTFPTTARLAFLPPDLTGAAIDDQISLEPKQIAKVLPLSWQEQRRLISNREHY
jgi:hypothetical protein